MFSFPGSQDFDHFRLPPSLTVCVGISFALLYTSQNIRGLHLEYYTIFTFSQFTLQRSMRYRDTPATASSSNQTDMQMDELPSKHDQAAIQVEYVDRKDELERVHTVSGDEPVAHLHAKTFLVVFAVLTIYFAQLFNIVAAGAVSQVSSVHRHIY